MTDTSENITFPQLRWWAVKNDCQRLSTNSFSSFTVEVDYDKSMLQKAWKGSTLWTQVGSVLLVYLAKIQLENQIWTQIYSVHSKKRLDLLLFSENVFLPKNCRNGKTKFVVQNV